MKQSAQIILEFSTEKRNALENLSWIANMVNNLSQVWGISLHIEPIDNGFILFCDNQESFLILVENLASNYTAQPHRNHPDLIGFTRWNLRFVKHPAHIPLKEFIPFIQNGLMKVYGKNSQFKQSAKPNLIIVDFPANITAGNLLTTFLDKNDQEIMEENEKFLSE